MTEEKLKDLIAAFQAMDEESLNKDPFSFSGKYVIPFGDSEIIKIMSSFDANGMVQIEKAAKEEGLEFFVQSSILYKGLITIVKQPKLKILPFENKKNYQEISLNYWCPANNFEEQLISKLVKNHYGEGSFNKIKNFCVKWYLGNIVWRNIGFDKEGKIKCFDFHCGLSRNEKGEYRCINRDV